MLQETNTRPIKILFDGTNIELADEVYKEFVMNKIIPIVQEYFRLRLTVKSGFGLIKMSSDTCYRVRDFLKKFKIIKLKKLKAKINETHISTGADADLVIYITFTSEDPLSSYISFSTPCILNSYNNRPIAGQLNINLAFLDLSPESFQLHVSQIIHEVPSDIIYLNIFF